ncbi:hypothetical protein T484DRAFT_1778629 [Baffinella frigidus]|nr:hypothetical protein T484DRAFT_1778629 [Cryptophyta sp. CCMP2293]
MPAKGGGTRGAFGRDSETGAGGAAAHEEAGAGGAEARVERSAATLKRLGVLARCWLAGQVWSPGESITVRLGGVEVVLTLEGFETRGGSGEEGGAGVASATIYSKGFHAEFPANTENSEGHAEISGDHEEISGDHAEISEGHKEDRPRVTAILVEEDTRVQVTWRVSDTPACAAKDVPTDEMTDETDEMGGRVRDWVRDAAGDVGGLDAELLRAARVIDAALNRASGTTSGSNSPSGTTNGSNAFENGSSGFGELRGMIVHGPAGVGKTALVRAILKHSPYAVDERSLE